MIFEVYKPINENGWCICIGPKWDKIIWWMWDHHICRGLIQLGSRRAVSRAKKTGNWKYGKVENLVLFD